MQEWKRSRKEERDRRKGQTAEKKGKRDTDRRDFADQAKALNM